MSLEVLSPLAESNVEPACVAWLSVTVLPVGRPHWGYQGPPEGSSVLRAAPAV